MPRSEEFFIIPMGAGFIIENIYMLQRMGGRSEQIARTIHELGWRNFEPPMPEVLSILVRNRHGIVFDVGANSGFYSILSAVTDLNIQVMAFEPYPGARLLLKENIAANKLESRITVSHLALSDKCGTGSLYIPTQEHGLVETSSSLEGSFKSQHSEVIEVPVTTLDSFVNRIGDGIDQVCLIKIDVEGHEASVVRGADQVIQKFRPPVFIEVLPGADLPFLNQFLIDRNYKDIRFSSNSISGASEEVFFDPLSWNHLLVPTEKLAEVNYWFSEGRSEIER